MRKYEKWKLELPRVHPYYGNCVILFANLFACTLQQIQLILDPDLNFA